MTGQEIVNKSIFGSIDPKCETLDGRNIGEMQKVMVEKLDIFINRLPQVIDQIPTRIDAVVAADRAISQMLRKQWGVTEIDVWVERNGQRAIQGANYRDIVDMVKTYVGNVWDKAK